MNILKAVFTVALMSFSFSTYAGGVKTIDECESIQTLATHVMSVRQSGDPRHVADELNDLRIFQNASYNGNRDEWFDRMTDNMIDSAYKSPIIAANGHQAKQIGIRYGARHFEKCVGVVEGKEN